VAAEFGDDTRLHGAADDSVQASYPAARGPDTRRRSQTRRRSHRSIAAGRAARLSD
jgi:hypothetical protein